MLYSIAFVVLKVTETDLKSDKNQTIIRLLLTVKCFFFSITFYEIDIHALTGMVYTLQHNCVLYTVVHSGYHNLRCLSMHEGRG